MSASSCKYLGVAWFRDVVNPPLDDKIFERGNESNNQPAF